MGKNGKLPAHTPDEIWKGDLLGRRAEAQLLEEYIESVAARPVLRDDLRSFTIAIDTEYGEGKTFFLKRFADHLALKHPVAFVDAWSDDLSDEPLTAIAATLKRALDPLLEKDKSLAKKLGSVMEATGKVAKIALIGAAKRALGLVITSAAVAAADEVISAVGDHAEPVANEASSSGEKIVEGMEKAIHSVAPNKLMTDRIAEFEGGQAALKEMKEALAAVVIALEGKAQGAPIVIVIDELDRCRPTYAIKLLEEIKHLFDVPGLVFVFGMHGDQLAHSVKAAYGQEFKAKAYLSRFIGRRYRLKTPNLAPLVQHLLATSGIPEKKMHFFRPTFGSRAPHETIAAFMTLYGVPARDAFQLFDLLQTCAALTGDQPLYMDYLVPLAIGRMRPPSEGEIPEVVVGAPTWAYRIHDTQGRSEEFIVGSFVEKTHRQLRGSAASLQRAADHIGSLAYEMRSNHGGQRLADAGLYGELLDAVGRFSLPSQSP